MMEEQKKPGMVRMENSWQRTKLSIFKLVKIYSLRFDTPWVPLLPAFNQICRMVQENKRYHGIDLRLDFADILWGAYCGYNEQLFDEPTGAFVKQDRWDEIQHGSSQFDVISPSYYHFPSDFGVYA